LLVVIVWGIGLASTVINNIPFVALMIPVIMDLQKNMSWVYTHDQLYLLWWALALGACLWWNGTIIWSASWVIACDIAKKQWMPISFVEFAKIWMPITLISLFVSSVYLLVAYYLV
jgi:Na+/H+ antiporter NhaD/arsenite permease-like protein